MPQRVPPRRQDAARTDHTTVAVAGHLVLISVRCRRHRDSPAAFGRHIGARRLIGGPSRGHRHFRFAYVSGGGNAGGPDAESDAAESGVCRGEQPESGHVFPENARRVSLRPKVRHEQQQQRYQK